MSKRILFVHHHFLISGAEKVLINVLRNLRNYDIEPILACPAGPLAIQMEHEGIRVHILKISILQKTWNLFRLFGLFFQFLKVTAGLLRLVYKERAEIIYANSFTACLFCGLTAHLSRKKLVWHMHDLIGNTAFNRRFVSLAGKWSRRVIATTEVMKNNLVTLNVSSEKITVIPNGVDTDEFEIQKTSGMKVRQEFGLTRQTPVVGIAGQLTPWKGHLEFLNAASKIIDKDRSVKFFIVGDNRLGDNHVYCDELKAFAETLGLSQNVIFTGFRTDIQDILSALNVMINASAAEPFGMTIIEAMALGVPVVAANGGGVPEIITDGQNGRLYTTGHPEQLAQAILDILHNPSMAESLSKEGIKTVLNKFKLSKQVFLIAELLQTI